MAPANTTGRDEEERGKEREKKRGERGKRGRRRERTRRTEVTGGHEEREVDRRQRLEEKREG